ncbi:MAG: L,D-transpeptidase family protein [Anaerolineae bacterium]
MSGQTFGPTHSSYKPLSLLEEGIQLAQRNERDAARVIFNRVIHANPESEEAWLWLAWLADDKDACLHLLREARQILPNSERVKDAIASVEGVAVTREPVTEAETAEQPKLKTAKSQSKVKRMRYGDAKPKPVSKQPTPKPAKLDPRIVPPLEPNAPAISAHRWQLTAVGILALGLVVVLLVLGITGKFGSSRTPVVKAFVLPTAITDMTPTASPQELTAPLFTQVDAALAVQDWTLAVDLLESIRLITPDSEQARVLLARAHFELGKLALFANELDQAQIDLDEAIRLDASDLQLHETRRALTLYMDGVRAYRLQDWAEVVRCLSRVQKANAGFRDTVAMLAQGYLGVARAQQAEQNWSAAQKSLEAALQLQTDFAEAQQVLIEVRDAITPPRRIEVSLTENLVRVYENHQAIRIFLMCDGKVGSPTRPGRFPVLDKLPLARAQQWGGLQMPWWIGIYYTNDDPINGIENGFHALPFREDQQVMWANSLGGSCSYGCIVLDTQDAMWLYEWVEIGTVVFIIE